MFDIGWTEMLVIAIVMIVVVGPKDLPKMLRTFGRTTSKMRSMAGEFRKQFDDAMREAELEDVKSTIDSVRKMSPASDIKKALNPMEKAAADVRAGLEKALKPTPAPTPAASTPQPAEPAKAGPTAMPGETPKPADPAPAAAPKASAAAAPAAKKAAPAKPAAAKAAAKPAAKTTTKTAGKAAAPKAAAAAKPAAAKKAGAKS